MPASCKVKNIRRYTIFTLQKINSKIKKDFVIKKNVL